MTKDLAISSMYTHLLFCLIGSLFVGTAKAECSVESITNLLSQSKLNATFVQRKEIKALNKPLLSSGKLWLAPQAKLVWQVNKPIKSTLVIGADEMTQYNRKDQPVSALGNIAPQGISQLFLAIAHGNLAGLAQGFELQLACQKEGWQLALTPKQQQLSQLISGITITGQQTISSFSYVETRGDRTMVELTHQAESLSTELSRYLK